MLIKMLTVGRILQILLKNKKSLVSGLGIYIRVGKLGIKLKTASMDDKTVPMFTLYFVVFA